MGEIFCVEFQRVPLKFHTKFFNHGLEDVIFIQSWNFKSAYIEDLVSIFDSALLNTYNKIMTIHINYFNSWLNIYVSLNS